MGIPSPFNGPSVSPNALRLRQASPEVPLLDAVDELNNGSQQAFEPLPVAMVDLKSSCEAQCLHGCSADSHNLDSASTHESENSSSMPATESVESDRGDSSLAKGPSSLVHADEKFNYDQHNTFYGRMASACSTQLTQSPVAPGCAGTANLEAQGVTKMQVSDLLAFCTMPADIYRMQGSIQQMLCSMQRNQTGDMMVVPCFGDDVRTDAEHEVFWCFVQPQADGSIVVSPCTDASACGVTEDVGGAPLAARETALPTYEKPSAGAFVPMWVYGPRWPFCAAPTTLICSNLPRGLSQEDLIEILDKDGFSGFYDFVHLSMDPTSGCNTGRAVINLIRHECGVALAAILHGRTSWCGLSAMECSVSWSVPLQGISQLIEHYRHHPSNRDDVPIDVRPTIFSKGFPVSFDAAKWS